jgi:predicted AAA+ superfamily ATPase
MGGFGLQQTGLEAHPRHWLRGGFPLSFLAEDDEVSFRWRQEFVQAFLERDVPQLGSAVPSMTMYRICC